MLSSARSALGGRCQPFGNAERTQTNGGKGKTESGKTEVLTENKKRRKGYGKKSADCVRFRFPL